MGWRTRSVPDRYWAGRGAAKRSENSVPARTVVVPYDQDDPDAAARLVTDVQERTGRVDVLVNSAVAWGAMASMGERFDSVDDWEATLRGNVEGAVRLMRAVTPAMRAQGWGRMVHVSSSLAVEGTAGSEYYAAAKAALHGFSRSAALSLGRDGDILTKVGMPRLTRTAINAYVVESSGDQYAKQAPLGRLLDASEVASAIVYLASATNTGITGQVIAVTGGA